MSVRRRRAVVLLALALACGALAASKVSGTVRDVEARTGKPVSVLVAVRAVSPGAEVRTADLAVRSVPSRYVPGDAVTDATQAVGAKPSAGLARGAYVTTSALGAGTAGARQAGGALRRGERAVEVAVTGGAPLSQTTPGGRVDVLVSTEPRDGEGRSFVALEDVELLALDGAPAGEGGDGDSGSAGGGEAAAARATNTATLRVTLRQAVYLTAAQNFAREVRLLPRPAGDRGTAGRAAVSAGGL